MELSGEVRQGWWRLEVTVGVGAILEGATIVVGCAWVGIFTEGGGDCLVPGVDKGLKVGEDVGGALFGVAMGTLDVPAGLEQEVDVGLVGEHRGGPPVAVGLPPLVFPFDPTEASLGGGGADSGQVLTGRGGREVGASRAGVGGEPVVHALLEFCLRIIIFEDIGDFALATVVEGG